MDRLGWKRRRAATVAAALIFVLGVPSATYGPALDFMSDVFGGVLLVLGGLLISVLMGWRTSGRFREDLAQSGTPHWLQRFLLVMLLGFRRR